MWRGRPRPRITNGFGYGLSDLGIVKTFGFICLIRGYPWRYLNLIVRLRVQGQFLPGAIIDCNDIIDCMASITIRQLPEATKRKLKIRAAEHGRSMEHEARERLQAE